MAAAAAANGYLDLAAVPAARLAYVRTPPAAGDRVPSIFYVPGVRSGKDGVKARSLELVARKRLGCGFTSFDYQGHGASSGSFIETHPGTWLADARSVFDTVTDGEPQIVVASSMAALFGLHLALARPERVAGLVLVSPAVGLADRLWQQMSEQERLHVIGGGATPAGRGFVDADSEGHPDTQLKMHFFQEARRLALPTGLASIPVTCPVRILHGVRDMVSPVGGCATLMSQLMSEDVSFTVLKDANHRLCTRSDMASLAAVVLALWEQLWEVEQLRHPQELQRQR